MKKHPSLWLPRQQPILPYRLKRGTRSVHRLVGAAVFDTASPINFVTNKPLKKIGTVTRIGTQFGAANHFTTGYNSSSYSFGVDNKLFTQGNEGSFVFVKTKWDTTANQHFTYGTDSEGGTPSSRFSGHWPWSDGNIYADIGGTGGDNRLSAPFNFVTNEYDICIHTFGKFGSAIWKNGKKLASNPVNISRGLGTTFEILVNGATNGSNIGGDNHNFFIFYIYDRGIPDDEALSFMDPIGYVFETTSNFLYKAPSGITGLNSTAVGFSDAPTFGSPTDTSVKTSSSTGFADAPTFGSPTDTSVKTSSSAGFSDTPTFGSPTDVSVKASSSAGFSDTPTFGSPTDTSVKTSSASGFADAPTFGSPTSSFDNVIVSTAVGFSDTPTFGSPTDTSVKTSTAVGFSDQPTFGVPNASVTINCSAVGFSATPVFGSPSATLAANRGVTKGYPRRWRPPKDYFTNSDSGVTVVPVAPDFVPKEVPRRTLTEFIPSIQEIRVDNSEKISRISSQAKDISDRISLEKQRISEEKQRVSTEKRRRTTKARAIALLLSL